MIPSYLVGPLLTLGLTLIGFAMMWGQWGQRIKDLEDSNTAFKLELTTVKDSLAKKIDKEAIEDVQRSFDRAIRAIDTRFDDLRDLIAVALGTKERRTHD